MSYILEALKKSDQQRQRGAAPTLQTAQFTVAVPKRSSHVYYGLLAVILLGAGVTIGWLHPWQPVQASSEAGPVAVRSNSSAARQIASAPFALPPGRNGTTAQEPVTPEAIPAAAQPVPATGAVKPAKAKIVSAVPSGAAEPPPEKPAAPADVALEQTAIPLYELPMQIQQEIPAMEIQLHAYSQIPGERLVSINSIRLREGSSLMAGLRLEQITPDGMIFSYKGYRFWRGIR